MKFVKENKPEAAVVEEINVEEYSGRVRDIEKFRASFNTQQLSKIIQIGLTIVGKQDLMPQKQDETLVAIREVKKAVEEVKVTVKEVSSKLDRTNELLERRFHRLEEEIEKIKRALHKAGIEV